MAVGNAILVREQIQVGTILWQLPKGERTYVVTELTEETFLMKNRETGLKVEESWQWIYMYREITANGEAEKGSFNEQG